MASTAHDSPVILLLAAGEGSRFGGAKQLADIAGEPMVRYVARVLLDIDLPVLVVTGAHADAVEAVLDDLPLSMVRCEEWRLGMGQSLATGVRALTHAFPAASAVLVCLADQPLLDTTLLRAMLRQHVDTPGHIFATEQSGVQAPPALFPREYFDALAALTGPHGARALLKQEAAQVQVFTTQTFLDVDTPEDLQQVQAMLASLDKTTGPH